MSGAFSPGTARRKPGGRGPRSAYRDRLLAALACLLAGLPSRAAWAQWEFDGEPINYRSSAADDAVARLARRLRSGEKVLEFGGRRGYLDALLRELEIPASSQALVFSKTSFQQQLIGPATPRAIYFNDGVYLGWVQGGRLIEIAAVDPVQGAIFYTLRQQEAEKPVFERRHGECLQCHIAAFTQGVPGLMVRSVVPDAAGFPVFRAGSFLSTYRSPLSERWGGWYVTGLHGGQRHMGNARVPDQEHPEFFDAAAGANVTELRGRFDTAPYLTPHSDLVALMVLEHQTQMHNAITRASYEARLAARDQALAGGMSNAPEDRIPDAILRRPEEAAEAIIEHLLFAGEAALTHPLQGTSGFAEEFSKLGPRDRCGRSLRDFDLKIRLFKHPCSYLIYSEAFDRLPASVKEPVYRRLWEVLNAEGGNDRFTTLSTAGRRAIREILLDTKKGLPEWWKAPAAAGRKTAAF